MLKAKLRDKIQRYPSFRVEHCIIKTVIIRDDLLSNTAPPKICNQEKNNNRFGNTN